jgi:hypothetical protein
MLRERGLCFGDKKLFFTTFLENLKGGVVMGRGG